MTDSQRNKVENERANENSWPKPNTVYIYTQKAKLPNLDFYSFFLAFQRKKYITKQQFQNIYFMLNIQTD